MDEKRVIDSGSSPELRQRTISDSGTMSPRTVHFDDVAPPEFELEPPQRAGHCQAKLGGWLHELATSVSGPSETEAALSYRVTLLVSENEQLRASRVGLSDRSEYSGYSRCSDPFTPPTRARHSSKSSDVMPVKPTYQRVTMIATCAGALCLLVLMVLVPLSDQLHSGVVVACSAILGASFLFTLLPPPPTVISTPPTPATPSPRRRNHASRARRLSTDIVDNISYRAASLLVDDGTKRELAEILMHRVTDATLTEEANHCEYDRASSRVSFSRMRRVSVSMSKPVRPVLPPCALNFVGDWELVSQDNYAEFLKEVVGLSWAVRRIAEHIIPTPAFHIEDGMLHCTTCCLGAKPVHEMLETGDSIWHEPNLNGAQVMWRACAVAAAVATRVRSV